ncbi:hypothetical protein DER46DRAFT_689891 [Fusarium sp. MPI-SDFR-AT-0072]|uniref:Uncharacterized protein n=1 Tax=Fusarium oxysporum f. sp. rapae TaxID=485398 RepID=A0A8J5NUJ2_FUSOX|nr:hypothetical protein Forpe1208_v011263 [Fusarium oxysporum f. sp. rapae]KAH7151128.1 hypothetical protein DER46DRAFT_689891 [Fusarium sp. MPI-SDFR-AT-0072]KAI7772204.1 hypothetical protein LZL87_014223 [Fusarium oxysporum]
MKLSTFLSFGALLLVGPSPASAWPELQFRPEILENNTTWVAQGAITKTSAETKDLPLRCPTPRASFLGRVFTWMLGPKKPKCKQFNIAAGETISGFPRFQTDQIHGFTFPNRTYFLHTAIEGYSIFHEEVKKGLWTMIPGAMTVTCYEGNDGAPHCVARM